MSGTPLCVKLEGSLLHTCKTRVNWAAKTDFMHLARQWAPLKHLPFPARYIHVASINIRLFKMGPLTVGTRVIKNTKKGACPQGRN